MPNNARYDEMMQNRFVDNDAPPKRAPFNFGGKPKKNGGLSDAARVRISAEAAENQAADIEHSDVGLQRAMGVQAKLLKTEALSDAKRARASALRRK